MNGRSFWAVVLSAALAACGDDDDRGGGAAVSCTRAGDTCSQLSGTLTAEQRSQVSALCSLAGGTFAAAACNTAGAVPGHCAHGDGNFGFPGVTEDEYYDAATWTAADAQADCGGLGGTWAGGTGGSTGGDTVTASGSCTVSGIMCTAYSGAASGVAAAQASCTTGGDTWSSAACSNGGAFVGVCTRSGTVSVAITYYPPMYDAPTAQAACSRTGGSWWAGNIADGNFGGTVQSFGCQPTGEPWCTDFSGPMTAQARAAFEAICTSGPGAVLAACPAANRTGTCARVVGSGVSLLDRFYVAAQAAEGQAACVADGGTWTAN